jgi:nitroimidazol reductase NimA-like FMN-containing flavoprotein (pyridoxamine 5'-phosphate oxidase superfamily)
MDDAAIAILDRHRTMAISTVRPDGWPQTTIVGYANDGLTLYFLIYRSSQKFANIEQDGRISIAVGAEPRDLGSLEAVYASAQALQVTEPGERVQAWLLLQRRHPNLAGFELPDRSRAAMIRAPLEHLAVLDLSAGLHGASEPLTSAMLGDTPA